MKNRPSLIALTLLMFLGAATLSAHDRFRFTGTVVKMDTAKTRIEKDGRKVTSADLKPGRFVVVDALGDDILGTEAVLIKIVPLPVRQPSAKQH
ncbi:MAG: hypothetical protein ABIQ52_12305 [Vicinamibacterales bacterium]